MGLFTFCLTFNKFQSVFQSLRVLHTCRLPLRPLISAAHYLFKPESVAGPRRCLCDRPRKNRAYLGRMNFFLNVDTARKCPCTFLLRLSFGILDGPEYWNSARSPESYAEYANRECSRESTTRWLGCKCYESVCQKQHQGDFWGESAGPPLGLWGNTHTAATSVQKYDVSVKSAPCSESDNFNSQRHHPSKSMNPVKTIDAK